MSSFDAIARIDQLCPDFDDESGAEYTQDVLNLAISDMYCRLQSQIEEFNLGVSSSFTFDTQKEWEPWYLSNVLEADETFTDVPNINALGADKTEGEIMPPFSDTPNVATSLRVLAHMGHGDLWTEWPALRQKHGVVDHAEYAEAVEMLSQRIMRTWHSMRDIYLARQAELNEALSEVAKNSAWSLTLNEMWKNTAREMHNQLPLEKWNLHFDCSCMPLNANADFDWVKGHYDRADIWKNGLYLSPRLFFKPNKKDFEQPLDEDDLQTARAACLAPMINLADMEDPLKLFALLGDRTVKHPAGEPFMKDYRWTHIGRASRILVGMFCGNTTASPKHWPRAAEVGNEPNPSKHPMFGDNTILELIHAFPNSQLVRANLEFRPRKGGFYYDKFNSREWLRSGEAHVTLVSQCLIFGFLDNILKELSSRSSPDARVEVSNAMSAPETWNLTEASQETTDHYLREERKTVFEAPGNGDPLLAMGPFLPKWTKSIKITFLRVFEQVPKLWTDIDYFWNAFQDELHHHHCWLPSADPGKLSLHTRSKTKVTDEKAYRWDLYYDVIGSMLRRHLKVMMMWRDLRTYVDKISSLKEAKMDIGNAVSRLTTIIQGWFVHLLGDLIRRGIFAASQPVRDRRVFRRATPEEAVVDKDSERLIKKCGGFPRLITEKLDGWENSRPEEEREAIRAMHDLLGNPVAASLFSMKKIVHYLGRFVGGKPEEKKKDKKGEQGEQSEQSEEDEDDEEDEQEEKGEKDEEREKKPGNENPSGGLFTDLVVDTVRILCYLVNLIERLDMHLGHTRMMASIFFTQHPNEPVENDWGDPIPRLLEDAVWRIIYEEVRCNYDKIEKPQEKKKSGHVKGRSNQEDDYHPPLLFHAHMIDSMDFEIYKNVPLNSCYRVYHWLDEKRWAFEGQNNAQPTHTDAEILTQIRRMFLGILERKRRSDVPVPKEIATVLKKSQLRLEGTVDFEELYCDVLDYVRDDQVSGELEDEWIHSPPGEPRATAEKKLQRRRAQKAKKAKERSKKHRKAAQWKKRETEPAETLVHSGPVADIAMYYGQMNLGGPSNPSQGGTSSAGPSTDSHEPGPSSSDALSSNSPEKDDEAQQESKSSAPDENEDKEMPDAEKEDEEMPDADQADNEQAEGDASVNEATGDEAAGKQKGDVEDLRPKLTNKHWETIDTLFNPGAHGTLASGALCSAFEQLGYDAFRPGGSNLRLQRNSLRCPWPVETFKMPMQQTVDNRIVQLHDRHKSDGPLDNVLLKKLKKRFETHGITKELIEEHFARQ